MLDYTNIIDLIQAGVRDWLSWQRNQGTENPRRGYVQDLVTHLVNHNAYSIIFERFVGEQTLAYYSEEAENKTYQGGFTPERFLEHTARRVSEGRARALGVFQLTTVNLVEHAGRRGLLEGRPDWLASGAVEILISSTLAYTEFSAIEGLNILCREFKIYVQNVVANIIKDTEHEDMMIEMLLEFKAFCERALQTAFVDPQTKQPNREFSYGRIRVWVQGKEEQAYRIDHKTSGSSHATGSRRHVGHYDPEFGMGDHMFNDLALSRDLLYEYRNRLPEGVSQRKLYVMVLQRSYWPLAARKDVDLPLWMQSELAAYVAFYKSKHQGRKLDWDHSIGTATLKARLYQAVVLLLFNESVELEYKQILEWVCRSFMPLFTDLAHTDSLFFIRSGADEGELRRTLQNLACVKKKVLRKRPVGKDVDETYVFYFNSEFTDLGVKVHINSIQAKETISRRTRTQSHIDSDRKHCLGAAIVRIIKAKGKLTYEQLKTQMIKFVKSHFVHEVNAIKQRIAGLVEQEYLRRDQDDMNKYIYVA
ncbi:hypothetical protein EDC04DRAFT_2909509 [Pisolithus marmoratus]|nr:hypothetical protein EDC04DRAFT_2909509 [Pisolithus marmoratus]